MVAVPALLAAVPAAGAGAAAPRADDVPRSEYVPRTLHPPAGTSEPWAWDVDPFGRAVGGVRDSSGATRAVVWDRDGTGHLLTAPGSSSRAIGTDERLRVVGTATRTDGTDDAALWTDGALRLLRPPGATSAQGFAVNRSGQVLGLATVDGAAWPFLWSSATGYRYLVEPGSREPLEPRELKLNDSGTVAGSMRIPGFATTYRQPRTAFRWTPESGLVDLLGAQATGRTVYPEVTVRLSESGVIAVTAADDASLPTFVAVFAVLPDAPPIRLTLADRYQTTTEVGHADVDDRGLIVAGSPMTPDATAGCVMDTQHLLWDRAGGQRLAPTPDLRCGGIPMEINDAGQIAGLSAVLEGGALVYVWDARRGARGISDPDDPLDLIGMGEGGHVIVVSHHLWGDTWEPKLGVVDPGEGLVRLIAPSIADTSVVPASAAGSPSGPLGTRPWIVGGRGSIGLMRFAVPAAPAGRTLVTARVHWWTTSAAGAGSTVPLEVRRVTGPWSQATTWADRPSVGSRRLGVAGVVGAGEPLSVRLDPSELPVKGGSIDLALVGSGPDGVQIGSREAADPKLRPVIELVYR